MTRIPFLTDENAPQDVTDLLRSQGHDVLPVGEHFAKGSADAVLTAAAEWEGLVVVTFDTDFKTLIKQVPVGHRTQFKARAGRIR